MINFAEIHGTITMIQDYPSTNGACNKMVSIQDDNGGPVNFVVTPDTYFVNHEMLFVGEKITGYYDVNTPVILIYPPQYVALIIVKDSLFQNIKVSYFNNHLISKDGKLKLTLSPLTSIILKNDQPFSNDPANHNLIVFYQTSTKSIPALTTPSKIIVWC